MKVHVFSDLHCEFNGYAPLNLVRPKTPPDTDLIICAGDLTQDPRHGEMLLETHFPEFPSAYVPGNHEFYRQFISDFEAHSNFEISSDPVHRLECDELTIAGQGRILGCTLWTDYELFGDCDRAMSVAQVTMADHGEIMVRETVGDGWSNRIFTPADALARHHRDINWLRRALAREVQIPTIVVTHHVPHLQSVPPEFEHDEVTPAFCSDLSGLIEEFQPALWVHGHTHTSFDYVVGKTRVICNPYGYGYENPEFDPALIVEI